ncbi:SRPBCC family protein [Devosia sp.]|uniref:SRPBCC family protein n=1 Tax=Devosia sp. TaxID=1871048 RepID=UPI0032643FEA
MDAINNNGATAGRTHVERTTELELVVTRTFDAPPHIVFQAWSKPELFKRWWAPKSIGVPLLSCEMDVRTGGKYRLEFGLESGKTFEFYGKYLEVVPNVRIVWTNDEGAQGAVTTVTFEENGGKTNLVLRDVYPTKASLDEAMVSGATGGFEEQFAQLDEFLLTSA